MNGSTARSLLIKELKQTGEYKPTYARMSESVLNLILASAKKSSQPRPPKPLEVLSEIEDLLFEAEGSARQDLDLVRRIRSMRNGKLAELQKHLKGAQ